VRVCLLILGTTLGCHHARSAPTQNLTASIVSSQQVTITWLPRCTVGHIDVATPESRGMQWMWQLHSSENAISSGVVYGRTPPRARGDRAAMTLTPGQRYRVMVGIIVGGDQIMYLADTTFIR
jgi:hypothetical protein